MRNLIVLALLTLLAAAALWSWTGRAAASVPVVPESNRVAVADGQVESAAGAAAGQQREIVAELGTEPADEAKVVEVWAGGEPVRTPEGRWRLRVRVVGTRGEPVVGAEVSWRLGYAGSRPIGVEVEGALTTDGDGCVEVDVATRSVSVWANGSQRRSDTVSVTRPDSGDEAHVVLQLEPWLKLRGRVIGVDGLGVAGAAVSVRLFGTLRARDGEAPGSKSVTTDAGGEFEAAVRPWCRYLLHARTENERSFQLLVPVEVEAPPPVELHMRGGISVEGVVQDAQGLPVANARVVAWDDEQRVDTLGAQSDDNGRFRVLLPTFGEYRVTAMKDGMATAEPVTFAPNTVRPRAQVVLTMPALGVIRGWVVGANGAGVGGAGVTAKVQMTEKVLRLSGGPGSLELFAPGDETHSAADGTFALRVHPRGTFELCVSDVRGDCVRTDVRADGEPIELVIDTVACVVRGVVRRADGGPVGGYRVMRIQDSGPLHFTGQVEVSRSGEDFEAAIGPIGRSCSLRVEPDDEGLAPVQVGPVELRREGTEVRFDLRPRQRLTLEVFEADGAPAAALRVVVIDAAGGSVDGQTDADGRVTLEGCVPGRSRLRCRRGVEVVHEQVLEVAPGTGRVTIVLPAANTGR